MSPAGFTHLEVNILYSLGKEKTTYFVPLHTKNKPPEGGLFFSLSVRSTAVAELKACNTRAPVETARRRDVLLGVPERAIVDWID